MRNQIRAFLVLVIVLTAGSASADQLYTVFDSQFELADRFYTPSIQDLLSSTDGTSQEGPSVNSVETAVFAGTFSDLACVITFAPGLGKGWIFTLFVNGSPTLLECSVSNTTSDRSCGNPINQVPVLTGDRVAFQFSPDNTPGTPAGSCVARYR